MAGVAATVVNDVVMVPADVIKQRLQINREQYRGILDCVMQTWQREGLSAFYRQASLCTIYATGEVAYRFVFTFMSSRVSQYHAMHA